MYVRRKPRVRIEHIQSGGGQERGMRSGTVPTNLAVGLGAAAKLCMEEREVTLKSARIYLYFKMSKINYVFYLFI